MSEKWYKFLTYLCIFLVVFQITLRVIVNGDVASFGVNIFIHTIILVVVAIWLLKSFLEGGFTFRLSGLEIPFLIFIVLCLITTVGAAHKMPAVAYTYSYISYILLFLFMVNFIGGRIRHIYLSLVLSLVFVLVIYAVLQYLFLFPIAREQFRFNRNVSGLPIELLQEFEWRLAGDEVFATFVLSNSFAGFLVIFIPLILGTVIDSFRYFKEKIPLVALYVKLILVCLALYTLYLTGSKGGAVAFFASILFLVAFYLWRLSQFWKRVVKLTILIAIIAIIVFFVQGYMAKLIEKDASVKIRTTYWGSAFEIIKKHSIVGIGLGNFGDYHTAYKSEEQNESIKVHNDYLQIGAELGIIGLVVFLLIWLLPFVKAIKSKSEDRIQEPTHPPYIIWVIIFAGFIAFILAFYMSNSFDDLPRKIDEPKGQPTLAFVLFLSMALYFALIYKNEYLLEGADRIYTIAGAGAGIVAFLVHILADFDFSVLGVAEGIFIALAIFVLLSSKKSVREFRISKWLILPVLAIIFIILVPALLFTWLKLIPYDSVIRDASFQNSRGNLTGRLEPKYERNVLTGQPVKVGDVYVSGAEELYREASQLNPFDIKPHIELAGIYNRLFWANTEKPDIVVLEEFANSTIESMKNAIKLRWRSYQLYYWLADYYYAYGKYYQDNLRNTEKAKKYLDNALENYCIAKEYYPTRAGNRYRYAEILKEMGHNSEALEEFRAALKMCKKAKEVGLLRLTLAPQQTFICGKNLEEFASIKENISNDEIKLAYSMALDLDIEVKKEKDRRAQLKMPMQNIPTLEEKDIEYIRRKLNK